MIHANGNDAVHGTQAAQAVINAIFETSESGGYLAIVEVPLVDDGERKARWRNLHSRYLAVRSGLVPQLSGLGEDSSWYFAPVLFSHTDRRKEHVIEGSTLWIDLDKEGADIARITPRPSIVVSSSPGKYHLYWLLAESLSPANLEYYNRRLAYAIGADKTGWDAGQLLRLPAGINAKREPAHPVSIERIDPTLRYELDDFAMLPELQLLDPSVIATELPTVGEQTSETVLAEYRDLMPAKLLETLARKQPNRSRALWYIYYECFRLGLTAEQCFLLVRGSPNDKFSDLRYLGTQSLWRDLKSAYGMAEQGQKDRGIIDNMQAIRGAREQHAVKLDKLGRLLVGDMQTKGSFFQTAAGSEFFYLNLTGNASYSSGTQPRSWGSDLINVEAHSPDLRRLVLDRYGVNPGTNEWLQLYEHIAARCQDDAPIKVHRLAHYEPVSRTLYINKFDNFVYRVSPDGYEIVRNGADGVLFRNPPNAEPFTISDSSALRRAVRSEQTSTTETTLWERLVLSCAKLSEVDPVGDLPLSEVRHILYSWFLALFFKELFPVKPILLVHGETGSGKTMVFKAAMRVLLGPEARPDAPYVNEDAFDNAATNSDFLMVDNVDDFQRWLANKLALVATSYSIIKRKLYTNNVPFVVSASCFVGITSRTPKFLRDRDDVAERLIPMRVVPHGKGMINEGTLLSEISKFRAELWTELMADLVAIVAVLDKNGGRLPTYQGDFRQADFGAFLKVTCALKGIDEKKIYRYIKRLQGIEALEGDPLVYILTKWISKGENAGRRISPEALYIELQSTLGVEDFGKTVKSPRALVTKIGRNVANLAAVGIIVTKHGPLPITYSFVLEA